MLWHNMRSMPTPDLLMRETTSVKSSEYSPEAMASKHSKAVTLEPETWKGYTLHFTCIS